MSGGLDPGWFWATDPLFFLESVSDDFDDEGSEGYATIEHAIAAATAELQDRGLFGRKFVYVASPEVRVKASLGRLVEKKTWRPTEVELDLGASPPVRPKVNGFAARSDADLP